LQSELYICTISALTEGQNMKPKETGPKDAIKMPEASKNSLAQITYALVLTSLIGWLCIIGKSIIVPILIGIITVYLFVAAADALQKVPLFKNLSRIIRRVITLIFFTAIFVALTLFVVQNAQSISATVPLYANNFETLLIQILNSLGIEGAVDWDVIITKASETVSITSIMEYLVSAVYSFGTVLVTALLYAIFLATELDDLPNKTRKAFSKDKQAENAIDLTHRINARIADYLGAKTLVNVILGAISLVILLILGVEYALFWALLIALFNYIPYIGSVIGVIFPVMMAFLQTGSWLSGVIAFITLMAAQIYVGSFLEPKMLGRSVNLSPFVVLLALSFWVVIWGSVGAILAVPLTAVIMIILSEIPSARPIAIMMSEKGDI